MAIEKSGIIGSIPLTIFNLSSLEGLWLWGNGLTGSIPRDIGNLSSLQMLHIALNNFTGMIPQEVGRLSELEMFSLGFNHLTGFIPDLLFNITTLRIIVLTYTNLLGSIPSTIGIGLPNLEGLYLFNNLLSGVVAHSLANCSQLSVININNNQFTGSIPNSLGNLRLLQILEISANNLTPEQPFHELSFITSLTKCKNLKKLDVGDNALHGTLPRSIGNLSSTLRSFYAEYSKFLGTIPDEIGNLRGVETILIPGNDLSGIVPNTLERLRVLERLDLRENKLSGPLTRSLSKVQNLGGIYFSKNRFSGSIPECLGNVTSLRYIHLDSNRMNGVIPSNLWNLKNLLILNLSFNYFDGVLHSEVGNPKALYLLDFSHNKLSGSIPSTLGSLQSLKNLSLAKNQLQGEIPTSIGGILSLESLDLSHNNLSGSIPTSLQAVRYLHNLNVSFNRLTGEIPPNGPFRNFTSLSFMSNEALCGESKFGVPPCPESGASKAKKIVRYILMALGITGVLALMVGTVLIILWRRKKNDPEKDLFHVKEVERRSYYELLRTTDGYNGRNLVGAGSFGVVYRGILDDDGTIIAIKVFKAELERAFQSFNVECKVLFNLRHRNLVKVLGYCSSPNFKALVLEYMPQGSLDEWLHSQNRFLDITQRLNIMLDVASSLEYLHHGYSQPVVHCDLKPSNILLDDEMVAHVADFGIAKLLGSEDSVMYTNTLATFGYIAPEYGLDGLVSTRCDVYSYGILLMETFTRMKPNHEMLAENMNLKTWVKDSLPDRLTAVIDANLLAPNNTEQPSGEIECLSSIMGLALDCCSESPTERICMKEVVLALRKIKSRLVSCL